MWRVWVGCASLCAAGCVSSSTWSAYREVERELAAAREEEPRGGADPATCAELASRIAAAYPTVRAARARARAALARGRGEGALPAPELVLEVWDFPIGDPQLADREGMYMAGVAQAFPPAAALDARARAAAMDARAALAEASEERRTIRARALATCVEWSATALEIERLREAEAIVTRARDALAARVSTGAPIAELARIEAELAALRRARAGAEARAARARARASAWFGRPLSAPPSIDVPEGGAEGALERALAARGALRAARARAQAAAARTEAREAEASVPTFVLRATYMQMPSARAGIGAAIGMTLPWLWSGEGAATEAARAEADAAVERARAIELEVRAEVAAASASLDGLARALAELRERERPAARRALGAMEAGLASGATDPTAWLEAARRLRELDAEEARLVRELALAWAELESAIGAPAEEPR